MASSTTISGDPVGRLLKIQGAIQPTVGDALFAGQLLISEIRSRTLAGVDSELNPFAPYSRGYAKRKTKKGGAGLVNLFGDDNHPHMLNGLQTMAGGQTSGNSTQLISMFQVGIFNNPELEERAEWNNEGTARMPRRHFLDANATDDAMIENAIGNRINLRVQQLIP